MRISFNWEVEKALVKALDALAAYLDRKRAS